MSLVLPSLVSLSLWITAVKISASGLMYVTGVTFLMDNTVKISASGLMYVTGVSPSLWITAVKIGASGLMYVTGVTVTGVTFLMDNSSEDQCIGSYVCHCVTFLMDNTSEDQCIVLCMSLVSPSLWKHQ